MARKHKKKAVVMALVYLCLAIGVWRWMGQRCLSASVQGEHPKKELRITEIQIKDKVYDKKNQAIIEEYELVGLGNEDLEQEVKKAIRLEAKYDDEQAGMDKEVQVKAFFSEGSALEEAYELRIEGKVKGNIKPKPVRLKLSQDLKVPYTQYREELLVTRVSVSYRAEDVIRGDEKEVDAMPLPQAGIMDEIPRVSDGQPCMTSEEGLPVIGISNENYVYREEGESGIWEQKQADGNYQFVFYEDEKKNLIIEPQSLTMDSLSCRKDSFRVYQDQTEPQTFWMGREGLLKLEPRDQMHYELVVYGRDQSGDLTGSGIGSREGDITCMVSLKAREPSNGVQPEAQAYRYSQSMQIRLKQDSAPPQVKISMGETPYITKEPKETMDFGIYSKSILEPSIRIRDWKDENGLGEGSGLGKVSYTVWKLEEDLCTQEQIQERIDASVWKPISWEEEDEIKISAGDLGISGPCYYAVLVKATDLVGNSNIYCSNGVAVDTRQPELDIRLEGEKARTGIYRGDVQAVVRISDCGFKEEHKTSTGIAEITWQIQQNGKIRESGTEKIRETTEKNRIKDLKNGEILTRKILIRKEYNSNDIKLSIKAKDRAGNEEISVLPLKIDVTEPYVSISYQSREEPQNGFYFKTDRIAVVTVTERNFDPTVWFSI